VFSLKSFLLSIKFIILVERIESIEAEADASGDDCIPALKCESFTADFYAANKSNENYLLQTSQKK